MDVKYRTVTLGAVPNLGKNFTELSYATYTFPLSLMAGFTTGSLHDVIGINKIHRCDHWQGANCHDGIMEVEESEFTLWVMFF